jgi:hypothetical protein
MCHAMKHASLQTQSFEQYYLISLESAQLYKLSYYIKPFKNLV